MQVLEVLAIMNGGRKSKDREGEGGGEARGLIYATLS